MKENEVRPKEIFDEYLKLANKDTQIFFNSDEFLPVNCPACKSSGEKAFEKQGFSYELCSNCDTLFVNPRPPKSSFDKYYRFSASSRFWATTFYKETEQARREKIWRPRVDMIHNKLRNLDSTFSIVDIGAGYGIFLEEFRKNSDIKILGIEPSPCLAEVCRSKGIEVLEKFMEDISLSDLDVLGKGRRVYTSFELFEHLQSPEEFISSLRSLQNSGDYFLFTTLSGLGVDIQTLWENSKSVAPPHHLNFFNPNSIQILFEKMGYEIVEVSTPGKLDIDIMNNNINYIKDRFWVSFLKNSTSQQKYNFQKFISDNLLSSHMMVIVKAK